MGAPSAESLSWPVALISTPPGACALIELRSIQSPPLWEISKSSLPTGWPLIVMRSFPLSAENTDGASAGFGATGEEGGRKLHRPKSEFPTRPGPALPGRAGNTTAARHKAKAGPSRRFNECGSRIMTEALREGFRRRGFGRNVQIFQGPEFAQRRAWVLRRSRHDNRPAGNTASVPRRVYENSLRRGRAAGHP